MNNLGIVKPGSLIEITFDTFAGSTGASITLTGLAVTDIEIYKDGSITQRSSDAGYTLLDTDGIDIDGVTGIHGFTVDLADNTVAGFYAAGSRYFVVVSAVTIDSQTVNFVAARFSIGMPDAVLNTTVATLASQTSFTLTAGPAEDDALNGCAVYIHDVASAVQGGFAVVSDYTGSTKTITLSAGTTFTVAASDHISVFPPMNTRWTGSVADTAQTGDSFARLGAPAGASVSADIGGVKSNTDTLLSRVTSTLFAGITSLAEWLGLLAGKQTGNTTARTEMRATGAAGGTYDETTDSQEALRDRGDAAYLTATGFATVNPDNSGIASAAAAAASAATDTAQIKADLPQRITKNTALAKFPFFVVDSADHVTGKTGLTVTAERSLDGAAFAACTNAVTEIANGWYHIDLAAADLNANTVAFKFTATGADARMLTIVTQPT